MSRCARSRESLTHPVDARVGAGTWRLGSVAVLLVVRVKELAGQGLDLALDGRRVQVG